VLREVTVPGLHELQAGFCQSVVGEAPAELLQLIAGDGFDPAARLGIYRNNVMTRLTNTLNAAYPAVCELVDARFFAYAATEFVRQNLPESGCLSGYGADFPAFLAGFAPAADLHYLADVARLEWAIHEIRQSAVLPPVPIAALAAMRGDPAGFKVRIKPTVRFLASAFAIDRIWIAHQAESRRDGLQLDGAGVWLQVEATEVLRIVQLAPSVWEFRARLAEGASLGSAVSQAFAISAGFEATSALAALFADELVADLSQGDDT
jgi:hypothetical protein